MKQQLCSRCKERPAVVFIQKMEDGKMVPEGLCIKCARELNVGSINHMIDQLGVSDEELEAASEQMSTFMENMGDFDFGSLGDMFNPENMDGAQTFPFANLVNGGGADDAADSGKKKKGKKA
ncbi:MAG: ATP-dependent Clp protease ATP-binding subunit, partial [Eubacterium sp.]